jgi:hypothetical protein
MNALCQCIAADRVHHFQWNVRINIQVDGHSLILAVVPDVLRD